MLELTDCDDEQVLHGVTQMFKSSRLQQLAKCLHQHIYLSVMKCQSLSVTLADTFRPFPQDCPPSLMATEDINHELYLGVNTLEPLLMTTPDSRPPCLWQTLTLVPTASPFRIVLKKPLFRGHLSTPYNGQLSRSQLYANNTFPQDCPPSLL